ncbi:unnamed protein product [Rotaria sp. Silwood1]|nr:unnamed protein product [Rotaria sp. Silwood1]CAF1619959.1 unnamed protein product [Rotaria sp. Silwood1]CAF1620135.1 unnamed protein product [Rotaria sp. Silwood1]CAF3744231.1 unnamed protein product [Rotaria sp. Silwood1]CAF3854358.1 unnamed protein product [Rotaria sp. Silwood1]
MYILSEEKRWYIINEWKKGSINTSCVARFLNYHARTICRIINYYRRHHHVNYEHDVGRLSALDSTQIKQLDRTIQNHRSATAAELLSLTNFNTTECTIQRYRLSLGYRPRKSIIKVKSNNINEQKLYEFATLHYRANIKTYIFEDECYVSLRNTQQVVWCKRGESTPKKEMSSLRAHVKLIGFIW